MIYGIIENGQCTNAIEADESFALSIGAVAIPDGFWIGDYYNGEWSHEKPKTETEILEEQLADLQNQILTMRLGGY